MDSPVASGERELGLCPAVCVLSEEGGQHGACISRPITVVPPQGGCAGKEESRALLAGAPSWASGRSSSRGRKASVQC